jgi:hypothetical protein
MSRVLAIAMILGLSACAPQPAPPPSIGTPGDAGAHNPEQPAADAPAQPSDAAPPPGPDASDGQVGADGAFPSLSDQIVGDTPSITISGSVAGIEKGQVDFLVPVEQPSGKPHGKLVHVAPIDNGSFSAQVPANYGGPIYLFAIGLGADGSPTADSPTGALAEPLQVGEEDITVSITIGENTDLEGRIFFVPDPTATPVDASNPADAEAPPAE